MRDSGDKHHDDRPGAFDRLADRVSKLTGQALFFAFCLGLVLVWLPSYLLFGNVDTWQLVINTVTTIVTFLLVALLQNTQRRTEVALHRKLNAIAEGLADLMDHQSQGDASITEDIERLEEAVGLERRVSA